MNAWNLTLFLLLFTLSWCACFFNYFFFFTVLLLALRKLFVRILWGLEWGSFFREDLYFSLPPEATKFTAWCFVYLAANAAEGGLVGTTSPQLYCSPPTLPLDSAQHKATFLCCSLGEEWGNLTGHTFTLDFPCWVVSRCHLPQRFLKL